jgi:transcriptional regulator with XRE-family HTH domain
LTTFQRGPSALAAQLRALREDAGLTGTSLAQQAGWGQSKVSKIETGRQLPTEDDIRQWARVAGAPAGKVEELLASLRHARVEFATWREQYRTAGGGAAKQADIAALEARATRIGEFQPAFIPGLLQTAQYARELLVAWALDAAQGALGIGGADVDPLVAARMQRQQLLYQPGKQVQLVVLEAALYSRVCSPEALAGQLDRLLAVTSLPNVEFGIIPFAARLPVFPICSFMIFDTELVTAETLTGEQQVNEPEQIALYDRFFTLLRDSAARGQDAVAIIHGALGELRLSR